MIRICPHVSLTRAVIRDHLSSELSGAERDGRAIASAALQIAPLDAHQKKKIIIIIELLLVLVFGSEKVQGNR
jgi:hypothetical protein